MSEYDGIGKTVWDGWDGINFFRVESIGTEEVTRLVGHLMV